MHIEAFTHKSNVLNVRYNVHNNNVNEHLLNLLRIEKAYFFVTDRDMEGGGIGGGIIKLM